MPTGEITSPSDATDRGLWHGGVHVIIYTEDGQVLIQRRSVGAMQFPGMLELSLGGFIDSGETPAQAAVREIKEETGLRVTESDLRPLRPYRYARRWRFKSAHKVTRAIVHTYAVKLADASHLASKADEVANAQFISFARAKQLVFWGGSRDLGRLMPFPQLHRRLLRTAVRDRS